MAKIQSSERRISLRISRHFVLDHLLGCAATIETLLCYAIENRLISSLLITRIHGLWFNWLITPISLRTDVCPAWASSVQFPNMGGRRRDHSRLTCRLGMGISRGCYDTVILNSTVQFLSTESKAHHVPVITHSIIHRLLKIPED